MTEPSQYFKGRTVQEQMDEVIGYVDKRAEEVAAAKAGAVLQPAEEAKTAAQAAAEAAEAAKDTTLAALPEIRQDISNLKAEDVSLDGRLDTVELKVTTAEGNIVTIQGQIVALQTADGQNVKITGNQTIDGVKTFTSSPMVPTVTTGTFDTQAANGNKLQNEILNNTNIVRTANNQNIAGIKTFTGEVVLNNACINNLTFNTSNPADYYHTFDVGKSIDGVILTENIIAYDFNVEKLNEQFFVHHPNNGSAKLIVEVAANGASLYFRRYKPDGTIKSTTTIASISDE